MPPTPCPHLGLAGDPASTRSDPADSHRCYAQAPPGLPDGEYQSQVCFTARHAQCPHFHPFSPPAEASFREPEGEEETEVIGWPVWRLFYLLLFAIILLAVGLIYGRDLLSPPPAPMATATDASGADPTAALLFTPPPSPIAPLTPASSATALTATPFRTPTPEPGGRVLSLLPKAGDAGWWASADTRGNHIGDSFLYAGYEGGQAFLAAFRLDLSRITRGAGVQAAFVRLIGLRDDRLHPAEGGLWTVALLEPAAIPDLARADFQTLLNAPAAASLLPLLGPADLARTQANVWELDPATLRWLEAQILAGETTLIFRITGPLGGGDTLFAWDSGAGPASAGVAPELLISQGPPPATLPPLPTQEMVIATLTPTPENVLTVAAQVQTATAVAATTGTYTPAPANIVTPTPVPANLATAAALGLPPLILPAASPANAATATFQAAYATAVALTTGTFTPIPTDALRATLITPTPQPANAATAVAQAVAATAQAQAQGTATIPANSPTPERTPTTAPASTATPEETSTPVTTPTVPAATATQPATATRPPATEVVVTAIRPESSPTPEWTPTTAPANTATPENTPKPEQKTSESWKVTYTQNQGKIFSEYYNPATKETIKTEIPAIDGLQPALWTASNGDQLVIYRDTDEKYDLAATTKETYPVTGEKLPNDYAGQWEAKVTTTTPETETFRGSAVLLPKVVAQLTRLHQGNTLAGEWALGIPVDPRGTVDRNGEIVIGQHAEWNVVFVWSGLRPTDKITNPLSIPGTEHEFGNYGSVSSNSSTINLGDVGFAPANNYEFELHLRQNANWSRQARRGSDLPLPLGFVLADGVDNQIDFPGNDDAQLGMSVFVIDQSRFWKKFGLHSFLIIDGVPVLLAQAK